MADETAGAVDIDDDDADGAATLLTENPGNDGPGDAEEPGTETAEGAPETYRDFVLPEGMTADERLRGDFEPVARELDLTQTQAQRLVDLYAGQVRQAEARVLEAHRGIVDGWAEATRTDAELGGDRLTATLADGRRALKQLGTPALSNWLDQTGAGSHPELVRFMAKVGRTLADDGFVVAGKGGGRPSTPKDFYPNSRME